MGYMDIRMLRDESDSKDGGCGRNLIGRRVSLTHDAGYHGGCMPFWSAPTRSGRRRRSFWTVG